MDTRLFPITQEFFCETGEPLISLHDKRPGRPPQNGHYTFLCGVFYVLRFLGEICLHVLVLGTLFTRDLKDGVKTAFSGFSFIIFSNKSA